MKKNALLTALLIYISLCLLTFFLWHSKAINTVTGDEPHYLVMSSGIVRQGSLEQTAPYKEEFQTRKIYKSGLAPEDAQPSPANTHAVLGGNGLFNVHNIGLPVLLSLPYHFLGGIGAKLMMIFLSSFIVVFVWKISSFIPGKETHRFWAVIAATASLTFIPSSNQIYPDVVAGLLTLIGLYWFLTVNNRRGVGLDALLTLSISFLPWLQIKFAATCLILLIAIVAKIYLQTRVVRRIAIILIIAALSCSALAGYNYYAFGKITGPYQPGALELSKTSLMVFLGLHIDQNQGFILQNPVNLIGFLAIGWMYRLNRTFGLVWTLVYLSLIVPNALHPAWYGRWSFSGRFQWAAATVFTVPTIFGMLSLANTRESLFRIIVIIGIALQLYFFYEYAIAGVNLFNKGADAWFNSYSIFYFPLDGWLPMLYNSGWAYEYLPNYFWLFLILALIIFGFKGEWITFKKFELNPVCVFVLSMLCICVFVCVTCVSNKSEKNNMTFKASQLPSNTGGVVNSLRLARPNIDLPGFLNYGPYLSLRKGAYEVEFSHKNTAGPLDVVGWVDVYDASSGYQLTKLPLNGTSSTIVKTKIEFNLNHWGVKQYEFRTYWSGVSEIELHDISLKSK